MRVFACERPEDERVLTLVSGEQAGVCAGEGGGWVEVEANTFANYQIEPSQLADLLVAIIGTFCIAFGIKTIRRLFF